MKKENLYLIILVIAEMVILVTLVWLATHSEFVTHQEFLAGLSALGVGITAGFWSLWSRISQISESIGYLHGRRTEKSKRL